MRDTSDVDEGAGRAAAGGGRVDDELLGSARELTPSLYALSRVLRFEGMDEAGLWRLPPAELELVRYVHHEPGVTVGALARELGLHASNVSSTVRRLVDLGMLQRSPDPDDRRITRLHVTMKAVQGMAMIENAWADIFADALATLPAEHRATLTASVPALDALSEALRARRAGGAGGTARPKEG
ncbi:MarR family transcriptional regulator [Streptomyces sp. N2-109]|uniref:MarR family transcriptional regulator n=1 Tax=Streptomyces gossypii TaxID=2883101 RepID=A0ABT2JNM8_9ACTN|nr:MarR family transcriptional regulator [Streptomyces gossypii]MCT2589484.1 MarR family transcriptional regulator [Streptomyces gossypii]